jgi:hypothetical protein
MVLSTKKNRAIHDTLSKTVQEIEIHEEIASVLEEIITDIETAHSLERQLYQERLQDDLRIRYQWATKALEEYKAMEKEKEYLRQKVGEALLHDLMVLEDKLEANINMVDDSVSSSRPAMDDRIVDIESSNDLSQRQHPPTKHDSELPPPAHSESSTDVLQCEEGISDDDKVDVVESKETLRDETMASTQTYESSMGQSGQNKSEELQYIKVQQTVASDTMTDENDGSQNVNQISDSTLLPAVAPKAKKITPNLQYLKSDLLMKIFEFMDAIDIVNMAQANVRLYTKVNKIFGLGGTIVVGSRSVEDDDVVDDYDCESEDLPPVVIDHDNTVEVEEEQAAVVVGEGGGENNPQPETTGTLNEPKDIVKTMSNVQKATIVSIPAVKSNSSVAPTETVTTKQDSASVNRQWDTSKALKSADSKTNTMASKTRTTAGFQMSASVAQSLASKLLPAELSAIIAMRDQLRKKEEELQKIQEDVIDLTAQLEGTISVKDVLASKLKELQKKVQSDEEISAKMTRQVASDQEVIAFLDERVQELEKAVDNFHLERTKANKAIEKVKDASERQVAVLSDMLTYEREQRSDQEKEWKNTKKVLIKEVKLCRAQIMALEAERDGFREENQRLKEALMARARGAGRSFDAIMS